MNIKIEKSILAVITTAPEHITGGVPIFIVQDAEEIQKKALILEAILDGMAHEIDPATYILVRH